MNNDPCDEWNPAPQVTLTHPAAMEIIEQCYTWGPSAVYGHDIVRQAMRRNVFTATITITYLSEMPDDVRRYFDMMCDA